MVSTDCAISGSRVEEVGGLLHAGDHVVVRTSESGQFPSNRVCWWTLVVPH